MELSDTDYDGIYEGVYDNFTAKGTYKISIYATDAGGVFFPPAHTEVIQMCPRGDITGDGIVSLADTCKVFASSVKLQGFNLVMMTNRY